MQTVPTPTPMPSSNKIRGMSKARIYWATVTPGTLGQSDWGSFDTSGRYKVDPEKQRQYGIDGLKRRVDALGAKVKRCIIYDQRPGVPASEQEITVKEHGSWTR